MIDKNNLVRIKWVGDGSLYIETNSNDKRLYLSKEELLGLLRVGHDFVVAYNTDFVRPRIKYEDGDYDEDGLY